MGCCPPITFPFNLEATTGAGEPLGNDEVAAHPASTSNAPETKTKGHAATAAGIDIFMVFLLVWGRRMLHPQPIAL